MSEILDAIREAIQKGDKSLNRIARDTGIATSGLSRLMSGERGLSMDAAEQLAKYLGLEITIRPKRWRKGR